VSVSETMNWSKILTILFHLFVLFTLHFFKFQPWPVIFFIKGVCVSEFLFSLFICMRFYFSSSCLQRRRLPLSRWFFCQLLSSSLLTHHFFSFHFNYNFSFFLYGFLALNDPISPHLKHFFYLIRLQPINILQIWLSLIKYNMRK
jgi:hypothetical protein